MTTLLPEHLNSQFVGCAGPEPVEWVRLHHLQEVFAIDGRKVWKGIALVEGQPRESMTEMSVEAPIIPAEDDRQLLWMELYISPSGSSLPVGDD